MTSDATQGRRAHERIRLSLEVAYRSTGSFLISYTVDLSRGGLFLETDEPRPVGSTLELRLAIPGANEEVKLQGEVVWIQREPAPGRPSGMGVEFKGGESRFASVIDELVKHFSGLRVLIASGAPRTRAKLQRLLRSSLTASYVDVDPGQPLPDDADQGFDLVLVDLMDGHAPAQKLLETLLGRQDPPAVVVLSSHPQLRRLAQDLGAHGVVDSPPASSELRAAVLRALGRPMLRRNKDLEDE